MSKLIITILLFGSVSFSQLRQGTESCFNAAIKIATNKIAKDAKTKNSVLNKIGLLADSCFYNGRSKMIICIDATGVEQFDVEFNQSYITNRPEAYSDMSFQFKIGTPSLNVYYVISLVRGNTANYCSYTKTVIYTDHKN